MSITLDRKWLVGLAVLAVIVIGVAMLAPGLLNPSRAAEAAPEQVAADFARAYYAADYRDPQSWLDRLQPHMTSAGYRLVEAQLAPVIWKTIAAARFANTVDQVSVEDKGLAAEGQAAIPSPRSWQIRRVQVTLAPEAQWPGMSTPTTTVNVLLEQMQSGGAWKVSTTLSDQSVELFEQQGQEQ